MNLSNALFCQHLKKDNLIVFPVPSAHLRMEPGCAEALVGARCHPTLQGALEQRK